MAKRPGRRSGVPRYRRAGQLSLVLPGTLEPLAPLCHVCGGKGCEFCPKVPEPEYCERNVLSGSLGCFCGEQGYGCQARLGT